MTKIRWIILTMSVVVLAGVSIGCDNTDDWVDMDIDGGDIPNSIPTGHGAYENFRCGNDACHGVGGPKPFPADDTHDEATDDDCASCHI